ncbi:MAG: type III pantothenate kinase [Phycisphaeraceae bacterium]
MNINLLAIIVGNARTRIGTFVDDKLIDTRIVDNKRVADLGPALTSMFQPLADKPDAVVMLASVQPDICDQVTQQVRDVLGKKVVRVEQDLPIPIGRKLDPETIVGDDRLLNAAAAYDVLKQACVVVDAGTAITVDLVDGAGTFHGGAIGPGAQMNLTALHERTAQLPEVELKKPAEPIGHNTVEAIRSGVFFGLRGMVRELVELYAEQADAFPIVVVTGGDAQLLFDGYDLVDRIVPDLTLLGMAATLKTAAKNPAES